MRYVFHHIKEEIGKGKIHQLVKQDLTFQWPMAIFRLRSICGKHQSVPMHVNVPQNIPMTLCESPVWAVMSSRWTMFRYVFHAKKHRHCIQCFHLFSMLSSSVIHVLKPPERGDGTERCTPESGWPILACEKMLGKFLIARKTTWRIFLGGHPTKGSTNETPSPTSGSPHFI